MASSGQRIRLNVGGRQFATTRSTLESHGESMLATLVSDVWNNKEEPDRELLIDRDGRHFHLVLNFLRNGDQMRLPPDTTLLQELAVEADFYQLPRLRQLCLSHPLLKPIDFKVGDRVRIRPEAVKALSQSLTETVNTSRCHHQNCRNVPEKLLGSVRLLEVKDSAEFYQFAVKCLGCLEEQRGSEQYRGEALECREFPLAEQQLQHWRGTVAHVHDNCLALAYHPEKHVHVARTLVIPDLE